MSTTATRTHLFEPLKVGSLTLPNRIWMAPLTRARSNQADHTQTPLHALYYAQRASAGLIISEATQISQEGQGYAWTPGIFTDAQVESWKVVTDAVHNAGGRIFCQLWHVGAISHPVFQADQAAPVSASVWTPEGKAFVGSYHENGPMVPFTEARALTTDDIQRLLDDYRHAARCAQQAGFDGVELHAANGYLIDQFLRDSVNQRDDQYGGSIENRVRLLLEAVDALLEVLPADRIGVRLSPTGGAGGSQDSDPMATYTHAARALSGKGLAYMHTIRNNNFIGAEQYASISQETILSMREAFDGIHIANGGFDAAEAEEWIEAGHADAVTFGRPFIANPDLPQRFKEDAPILEPDSKLFYGGGAEGYTDYPTLHKTTDALNA